MHISFLPNKTLPANQVNIVIEAAEYTDEIQKINDYLDKYDKISDILSFNDGESVRVVHQKNIMFIEVFHDELRVTSDASVLTARGRFYKILEHLDSDFIQIGRATVINLNFLQSLETVFIGNPVAVMTNGQKLPISRRYLVNLKHKLGI